MNIDFKARLSNAKRPLVLAVGGGNDSVSTLFLQTQLAKDYDYQPECIAIAAMLPDCLDYQHLEPTNHPLVNIITDRTTRSVQGKPMRAFPEQMLATHKSSVPGVTVGTLYGLSMAEGSTGIAKALKHLLNNHEFDLVLAIDVGGDFIAVEENLDVLSPMMDGYMLHALRLLSVDKSFSTPVLYSVFGLGTDGESTPEMLDKALKRLPDVQEGSFDAELLKPIVEFYRTKVEPNRYSRTADFTIREIDGTGHENPATYRGRFHVATSKDAVPVVHYGNYQHTQNPAFFGKYYLFSDLTKVMNPFAFACSSGITWFLRVQDNATRVNHELNGQAYMDIGDALQQKSLAGVSLFFGTPSRKFSEQAQNTIAQEVGTSVKNGVYDMAFIYAEYEHHASKLPHTKVGRGLLLIGRDQEHVKRLSNLLSFVKPT